MTGEEFRNKYDNKLREIAKGIADSVVIRKYVNGCSEDVRRATNVSEKKAIEAIAYGAMLAYRWKDSDIDGILDMAEFTLMQFIPEANTYDSIYIPLRKVTETGLWEKKGA